MKLLFAGKDRVDALPGIQEMWESGKIAEFQKAGMTINPDFLVIELETAEAQYLADRFWDLSSGRSSGGWGVAPLTWQDLVAYCQMRRTSFTNWEINLIQMMDHFFCKHANEKKD